MRVEPPPVPLVRRFFSIPDEIDTRDERIDLSIFGFSAETWSTLEDQYRIVILADAGAGKTFEMRAQAMKLRATGRPAFFLRIEDLGAGLAQAFEVGTSDEYDAWKTSTDEAWFFLDSIDEAKLESPVAFEKALRRFAAEVHDTKHRAHIFLSSRPYAWATKSDRSLVEQLFDFRAPQSSAETEQGEGDEDSFERRRTDDDKPAASWKIFKLAPLNADDVRMFAAAREVPEIEGLLAAIARADLWSMTERPFDLDDIFGRWSPGQPLGSRLEILQEGIRRRLQEIDENRLDRQPLSLERALDGARRLAAAVTLTKENGIRVPDGLRNDVGVDAAAVLGEWDPVAVKALLSRAIFNDAIFGAVRFRHREVRDLLTAEWLSSQIEAGRRRAVEAMLFRTQYGVRVIVPTMKTVLPWLILFDGEVRAQALEINPEIAAEGGDPARLPLHERRSLLAQIVERMGSESEDRAAHNNDAIARIAQRDLADETKALIDRYRGNDDAIFFLARFVWQGEMQNCTSLLIPVAIDPARGIYSRIVSARAILSSGTTEERLELWNGILANQGSLDRRLLAELLSADRVQSDVVPALLLAIDRLGTYEEFETSGLTETIHRLIDRLDQSHLLALVRGLAEFLDREPHIERGECTVSEEFTWLLGPAVHASERLIEARSESAFDESVVKVLATAPSVGRWRNRDNGHTGQLSELVPAWPEFNDHLYWYDVQRARARKEQQGERLTDDWAAAWVGPFWRFAEVDFDRVLSWVNEKPLFDDRLVALNRAFWVYRDAGRPRRWRDRLNVSVRGEPDLAAKLRVLFRPPPSEAMQKHKRQARKWKLQHKQRERKNERNRRAFVNELKSKPDQVRYPPGLKPGELSNYQFHLLRIAEGHDAGSSNRAKGSSWRRLIDEFGLPVAEAFRDASIAHWRSYTPAIRSEGANGNSTPYSLLFGMLGAEFESSETENFASTLSEDEARHLLRYAGWQLNGLPRWLEPLFRAFPDLTLEAIWREIEWELANATAEAPIHYMLDDVQYHAPWMHAAVAPQLLRWLSNHDAPNFESLRQILSILISGGTPNDVLVELAMRKVASGPADQLPRWYALWVNCDPDRGIPALTEWLDRMQDQANASRSAQIFISSLQGGRRGGGAVVGAFRTAQHLKSLYVLMHRYIRAEDDIDRAGKGVYSPELRDDAQEARNLLFNQLAEIPGKAAYTMLRELSRDHPVEGHRKWMGIRARERAIADADLEPWSAIQVYEFARLAELTPTTPRQLFDLATSRLLDFKDWLERGNDSPAETYRRVENETEMRNLVAGWLNQQAQGRYTTAQEPELANSQRSDFWLQSPSVVTAVPVELKLADKRWSGQDLCERLRNQLVGDYLRERLASAGIMLLVWQGRDPDRRWKIGKDSVAFPQLADALQAYWESISGNYPNIEAITVVGIDLTVRGPRSKD